MTMIRSIDKTPYALNSMFVAVSFYNVIAIIYNIYDIINNRHWMYEYIILYKHDKYILL